MHGRDYFVNVPEEARREWSPTDKIAEVACRARSLAKLGSREDIVIYKDAQVVDQNVALGTLADASGVIELFSVLIIRDRKAMWQAALARAQLHAEEGEWGKWSRACSEADYWEAASVSESGAGTGSEASTE